MFDSPAEVGSTPCKIDPEEMLQRARIKKEKAEKDLKAFMGIKNHRINRNIALEVAGALYVEVWEARKDEERWLAEIDKE